MDRLTLAGVFCTLFTLPVPAQESCAFEGCDSSCGEPGTAQTTPGWVGNLMTRSALTGDWGGSRSAISDNGITFTGNATQFYSGVTHGGQQTGWHYGGHNDYTLNIDMAKAIGLQGNLLKIGAEHRYGGNVNSGAGALLPANLAPSLPVADSEHVYITNFLFTQFLSETTAVYFGKLDTLDGDLNAFAHGRGKTQFLNTSLALNPAILRVVPYSTLGVGALFILGPESVLNIGVLNATDTATTSGISELFSEGAIVTAEGRFATSFFGKPGHQTIGGAWSSRTYVSLQQDPRLLFPRPGIPIARQTGAWSIYYNFDQYLFTDAGDPSKGWGVFGRFGISDGNPSPIDWFLSFGLGGSSPLGTRQSDTWGVGWFSNSVTDELGPVATAFMGTRSGQGVEVFYNYEVTPWFHFTSDIQYIHPSNSRRSSDAMVVGFRAKIDL